MDHNISNACDDDSDKYITS